MTTRNQALAESRRTEAIPRVPPKKVRRNLARFLKLKKQKWEPYRPRRRGQR